MVQLVELYYLLPEEEFEVKSLYFLCLNSFLLVAPITATGDYVIVPGFFNHCAVTCPVLNFLIYISQELFKY